jgi:uncharacterized protein (DUF488 family)
VEGESTQAPKDLDTMITIVDGKTRALEPMLIYMVTASFREGISEVLSLMTNYNNLAVMCSEAVPWRCHRRMIADYLTLVEGISVFDIIDSKQQPETHQLTSFAHLTDSKITIIYPEKTNKSTNK